MMSELDLEAIARNSWNSIAGNSWWHELDAVTRRIYTRTVEAVIDASGELQAQAWDEGRKHGATYPYGKRGLAADDNPYRSAK